MLVVKKKKKKIFEKLFKLILGKKKTTTIWKSYSISKVGPVYRTHKDAFVMKNVILLIEMILIFLYRNVLKSKA